MKATYKFIGILFLLTALTMACSNNEGVIIEAHDENRMMTLMHNMMAEMHTMKVTQDPDIDYATMMKMHHQGALKMAELELNSGSNSEIKAKAQNIIDTQKKEIAELESFLTQNTPKTVNPEFHMQMMEGMEKMGKQADLQIINGDIDHDFATLMIEHHRSATEMAQMHLLMGKNAQLKTLSSSIIKEQNKEIAEFQTWLLADRSN